ncbi:MAG: triose-phosphate isomerase [Tissierellia bacterium]|nr:triose-phosphate isomerase [Tissierellia bacterium]
MRIPIIAGNWKMNKTISESTYLVNEIKESHLREDVEVVVAVPFTSLTEVKKAIEGTRIKLAAQNMHWEGQGAYTGEISPLMLKEIGIDYCIIGHSERRQYFNETDETVNKKAIAALSYSIKPIICVGETLEQREKNEEEKVVEEQILKAFEGIEEGQIKDIVIAYEPVWAIGTGRTASSEDANKMCGFIRKIIGYKYGEQAAKTIRIQYGGSVKPTNIKELMDMDHIDGALVGGASLVADDFVKIVNY